MSDREKKLLAFFAIAGFAIVNFLAFNFATGKKAEYETKRKNAEQTLENAITIQTSSEQLEDEMAWLEEHEPEPVSQQEVQNKLQSFVESQATTCGLTIKKQNLSPIQAEPGKNYLRAKFAITVTGTEESLYRWFGRINVPEQFRAATQIRLSPNQQDDTKIDCAATIEQWFIPPTT